MRQKTFLGDESTTRNLICALRPAVVPTIIRRTEDRRHARQFLPHAVVAVQDLVLAERLKRHDRVVEVLRQARLLALVRPYHG